jgi:transcriptional regulator with XRE-family HTH domain
MTTKFDDLVKEVERTSSKEDRAVLDQARRRFDIGLKLLERRMSAGFTQQQLAEASGIPQSEISRIERGQANPTVQTLEALGAPLGIALDYTSVEETVADQLEEEAVR